ncbi:hypothetical protein J4227_05220 [Candidatus Woesearchaeota archaeon]|nr:hypothetical protein [Candidatus Woesearchaeota archaeon]
MRRSGFFGRRGVSPLIATVVLIGFAVSLGAVIMSWGKTIFEEEPTVEIPPEQSNLVWYMGSNIENVCYSGESIKMTLKSDPKINIKSIFVAARHSHYHKLAAEMQLILSLTTKENKWQA